MKKNLIGLLILFVLGAIAYFTYQQRGSGTLKPDLYDFAVEDTSRVTKIFLANKTGERVTLERNGTQGWLVNKEHKARKDAIDVLLKTIKRVEMKAPVAKTAHDNIVKLLAGKSVKVEIYQDNELVKTYYVGDATKDNMGTYMHIEGSRTPFVCHIPGFMGYLTSRYMTRSLEWRDSEVFNYQLAQIAEVKVDFHQDPERSFKITHSEDRKVSLFKLNPTETRMTDLDTVFVKRYLLNYRDVRFEGVQPYDKHRVDSIVNSPPYFTIEVKDRHGAKRSITSYRLPANPDAIDGDGNPLVWDTDRMHGVMKGNENEVLLIQYFSFDRLTIPVQVLLKDPKLRRDN